jgi:hypothetical protein
MKRCLAIIEKVTKRIQCLPKAREGGRAVTFAALVLLPLLTAQTPAGSEVPASRPTVRQVAPGEEWAMREGRFHRNGQWVFIKTGKLLRAFADAKTADKAIADIDVLVDRLNFNNFSLNIYPDTFDADGDGRIDPGRREAYANIGRILDHGWKRGVFCSLSFETYNIGGGGTPATFFEQHPEAIAINALGEKARDHEYTVSDGKLTPSVYHPAYHAWSRGFIRNFLSGLGADRCSRLLFVETTVEPQYPGACRVGDKDPRRAFLDFNEAAHQAFNTWQRSFPEGDAHRTQLAWPTTVEERSKLLGNRLFNDFRAWGLAKWVSEDGEAIRSVARDVYIAVDYNGRFDDKNCMRVGTRDVFLSELKGIDIIQIAPHPPVWTTMSWDDVIAVDQKAGKRWAISEHMSGTGSWGQDDKEMTGILENTLARGTRFGWDLVNAGNRHATDDYHLYDEHWHSQTLDIIDGENWPKWLAKIGVKPFVPQPR